MKMSLVTAGRNGRSIAYRLHSYDKAVDDFFYKDASSPKTVAVVVQVPTTIGTAIMVSKEF